MFDLFNEILQTLRHNKLRTALTGFAVAWGIFMLIVLLGMGNGVTNSFKEHALAPGSQKMRIWGGRTSKPYHGYKEGRSIQLKNADLALFEKNNHDFVEETSPIIYGDQAVLSSGKYSRANANYNGVSPAQIKAESSIEKIHGRIFNERDMEACAKVMILPLDYAKQLFPPDGTNAIGQRVRFGELSFLIVGVFESGWNRDIYVPYTTAQMLAGNEDNPDSFNVMLKGLSSAEEGDDAEKELRKTLASNHDFNPEDDSAVWIWNQFSQGMKGLAAMNILNLSIWILGLLTLLSGVVGISNIMFVSVKERTHEIGIRRAIGAKPHSILIQIIAESVAITTLFGYIGIVLGTLVTQILDAIFGDTDFLQNPTVDLSTAIQVTVVLIIAGALAGLFPALKSLKVKPVEALRDE